jgi:hypothetical protein
VFITLATVQPESLAGWLDRYERAWRAPGAWALEDLFTHDASYSAAPFEEPLRGRAAIAAFWEASREGPDEAFDMAWQPVALEGSVGVARVEVRYAGPPRLVYRDIWIVDLDDDGRCVAFEEWPFFPGQPRVAAKGE